ncbi:molybdenum cofactor biosynthesis protein B, partial [Thermodesulfobacteriota bacterium]
MKNQIISGVLTISDKGSRGERYDESGEAAAEILENAGFSPLIKEIIPDNRKQITDTLVDWVENKKLLLIVTSGGTGLSPSDVTPQAMQNVIDYEVPGMSEAMRAASLRKTPHAMISRA